MIWLKEKSPFILLSLVLGILMVLFLLVPIVGSLAGGITGLSTVLTDETTINAIGTSFYCALLATLFVLLLGVPFAYLFVRREFPGKKVLDSLIDMPILIPHNTAGIALLTVLGPSNPIGAAFSSIGLRFIDTILGIVVAMAFVSAPFMIRSAQEAFLSIPPQMEKSGRSLGATKFKVFSHITLPLATRGILTGSLLTWARAVSEFGAVMLIAYYPKTAPVHLYDAFIRQGLSGALPINALLILLAILILVIFKILVDKPIKSLSWGRR